MELPATRRPHVEAALERHLGRVSLPGTLREVVIRRLVEGALQTLGLGAPMGDRIADEL